MFKLTSTKDNRSADTSYLTRDYRSDDASHINTLEACMHDPKFGIVSILADIAHAYEHENWDAYEMLSTTLFNLGKKIRRIGRERASLSGIVPNSVYRKDGHIIALRMTGKGIRAYGNVEVVAHIALASDPIALPEDIATWDHVSEVTDVRLVK